MSNLEGNGKSLTQRELYTFSGFSLDVSSGLLTHSGAVVRLAPRVYQVLAYLVTNRERIVSKDEIFSAVWQDTFVEDNALSYTISQLRKTLAAYEPDTVFVETVPRRGFRFVAEVKESETALSRPNQFAEVVLERRTVSEEWIEESDDAGAMIDPGRALPARTYHPFRKPLSVALLFLLAVFVAGAGWYFTRPQPLNNQRTIAVMPLKDLSGANVDNSLTLGLTDALIRQLGRAEGLVVRPLGSTLTAAEGESDSFAIGRKLGVDAIVDWKLQPSDGENRISAQLLNVADGKQLWEQSFVFSGNDLFSIQDSVADLTARALVAHVSDEQFARLHEKMTANSEAYQAYLRGRYHWSRRNLDGFQKALAYFEQAVSLDPRFAEAHAGIADVHLGFYDYGYKPATTSVPEARAAVERALALKPTLSEAFSARASIAFLHDRDWAATEADFARAIELSPRDATPRLRFGWMLSVAGRTEEGLVQLRKAEELDPTSRIGQTNIAYNLMLSGDLQQAESVLLNVIRTAPDFSLPHWYLGTIYFLRNDVEASMNEYFTAFAIDEGNSELVDAVRAKFDSGQRDAGLREWREALESRYAEKYFPPSNIALVAAFAKDRENTMKWLRESLKVRDPWLLQILHDPEYRFLAGDQEFDALINELRSGISK
ncbi:MAG: winged helix-turn-helix domain-containing protein [Acidobacteria bacterium]|nr:winged helix-turn-helix domain-containing protein [Acidobacteriota bacterium]